MGSVTDIDGNTYTTVIIGALEWTVGNLRTTKLNDGASISNITNDSAWGAASTPAYCWYGNDESNKADYGALYNWYAANNSLLPISGWRIPTDDDLDSLVATAGGLTVAGGVLKQVGTALWAFPNTDAIDSLGWTTMPGGYRHRVDGFYDKTLRGAFYSSSQISASNAYSYNLTYNSGAVSKDNDDKTKGLSLRCVREAVIRPITGTAAFMNLGSVHQ